MYRDDWSDRWITTKFEVGFLTPRYIRDDVSVADFRLANGEWNKEFTETLFDPVDVWKVFSITILMKMRILWREIIVRMSYIILEAGIEK